MSPGFGMPRCVIGNKIMFSEEQAKTELEICKILFKYGGQEERKEKRIYECGRCHMWHLTSQDDKHAKKEKS